MNQVVLICPVCSKVLGRFEKGTRVIHGICNAECVALEGEGRETWLTPLWGSSLLPSETR